MADIELTFTPPATWEELPAEVLARVDRLTEDLAALGADWFLHVAWGDRDHGTHALLATPANARQEH